ncbi:hypothetical protein COOONC_06420 [Cooperia oncophora]
MLLGLHTAKNLFTRGATVILTCRDEVRGRAALEAVQSQVENGAQSLGERLHLFTLDLACYQSILTFCHEIKQNFNHIDVLINNAGVMGLPFELSRNGIEMHFATNAFGHYVLVNNLLTLLESSNDGRIVIVSSGLYKGVSEPHPINTVSLWANMTGIIKEDSRMQSANWPIVFMQWNWLSNELPITYRNSRKVDIFRRLSANHCSTKVYAIRPGFVGGTELGRETHWLLRSLASPVIWLFSKNLDQGIESIVHCAVTPNDELTSGAFYHGCQEEEYGPMVTEENAANMWRTFRRMEELILIRCHTLTEDDRRQAEEGRRMLP